MRIADFLRLHTVRAPNIMWFLGAGASAAAGVPTAQHMIWEFKRLLYCAEHRVSIEYCSDLGDPVLRARLQGYFDTTGRFPPEGTEDEYAHYFEAAYPSEADRRRYIETAMSGAAPSYGHLVLAALAKLDRVRIVWTLNFDRVVEDALVLLLGSGRVVVATLDAPQIGEQALNEGRWPLLVKLHGDFQSRRLKNTTLELREQDARLRQTLVKACQRYGLAVVGYSGRDQSIVEALEEAINGGQGYPSGLFWFHRHDSPPVARVAQLIDRARGGGIDAHVIEVETFDELLADIMRLVPDVPDDIRLWLNKKAPRVSNAPVPDTRGTWPVIRLNALPVLSWPATCRRIVCGIGGTLEVREAIKLCGASVIASRRKVGVIAFGSDADVRKAFESHGISEFDLHSIEPRRLRYESAELGLLYQALARSLVRNRPLKVDEGNSRLAIVDPTRVDDPLFAKLREATGKIVGTIAGTSLSWTEAIRVRLEHRLNRLWVLVVPTVWAEAASSEADAARRREFLRERQAARFNRQWNAVLEGWLHVITGGAEECEIRAFGIGDGVDAAFRIGGTTAFSFRESAP